MTTTTSKKRKPQSGDIWRLTNTMGETWIGLVLYLIPSSDFDAKVRVALLNTSVDKPYVKEIDDWVIEWNDPIINWELLAEV